MMLWLAKYYGIIYTKYLIAYVCPIHDLLWRILHNQTITVTVNQVQEVEICGIVGITFGSSEVGSSKG